MRINVTTRRRRLYPITLCVCLLVKLQCIAMTEAFSYEYRTAARLHNNNLHPARIRLQHYQVTSKHNLLTRRIEPEMWKLKLSQAIANDENKDENQAKKNLILSKFSLLAPVWTSLAALYAICNPSSARVFGSPNVMQNALLTLMFAMGMAILPKDVSRAISNPKILMTNAILCFGMVPLLGLGLSKVLGMVGIINSSSRNTQVGLLLLASVSGGQASNLFTLIAGGDVALSVICTLSTTILGVLATPLLAQFLLGQTVEVKLVPVLKSVASLVLVPLVTGLGLGQWLIPTRIHQRMIVPFMPVVGILATLILVAGGASSLSGNLALGGPRQWLATALPSTLLCLLSGAVALQWINFQNRRRKTPQDPIISETAKRALVVETLSKSPTLAYFLASRHFGTEAAAVPAAAMITLAVLGALVASLWSALAPVVDTKDD